jgi:type I restriction-modification system DNA methylase subunit
VRELRDRKQFKNWGAELSKLFREMDGIYNSELFSEKRGSDGMEVSPDVLEQVIEGLYQKHYILYNFNALESDVLGTVYEQYLGAVVADKSEEPSDGKKDGKQTELIAEGMTVQERRKKRKSQGIYYTPSFVTKYIVQQTVGKYVEENGYNPSKPPRILDMACGSGSFLIETFDVMDEFVAKQRGHTHKNEVDFNDRVRQIEVLQNCIYGVDKDKQALEVARLNLLLRALHSPEKLPMLKSFHLGDSLHPETWEIGFPEVMKDGGFDIIIGNPPYIRAENMARDERDYYMSGVFESAYGRFDIFILFIETAINLLKKNGLLGFIIPRALLNQNYAKEIRRIILEKCTIEQIVDFGKTSIFDQAAIDTCIIVLKKVEQKNNQIRIITPAEDISNLSNVSIKSVMQDEFSKTPQFAFRLDLDNTSVNLISTIKKECLFVGDICYVDMGLIAYYKEKNVEGVTSKESYISNKASRKFSKPYAEGKDLSERYHPLTTNRYIWYEPSSMHRPKFPELFENPKIVISKITGDRGLRATFDEKGIYVESTLNCCVLANMIESTGRVETETVDLSKNYSLKYLLGLMNSKLLGWYYKHLLMRSLDVYPDNVRQLPIRRIDITNPADKSAHDEIVSLVEKMLSLQKERQSFTSKLYQDEIREVERKIAHVDEEINQRVYRLYGLSEEEIKIVEGK